jgi:hypothetical protein
VEWIQLDPDRIPRQEAEVDVRIQQKHGVYSIYVINLYGKLSSPAVELVGPASLVIIMTMESIKQAYIVTGTTVSNPADNLLQIKMIS